MASVALLQDRTLDETHRIAERIQQALLNRVIVEQAKGALSERAGLDPEEVYLRLRRYARAHNLKVGDVARQVMDRSLDTTSMLGPDPDH
ncbi:ANTAR domain-containing protein [Pseudonocardia xishanensis]|uniref:ANTAR domain-containing protein n=1 Tax=Pseudonocardia xishanensis TaxID=630995 RepID=UPI0031EAAC74